MIDWLFATLRQYPEIAIFLTLAIGFYFGKFKFKGIGLGAVTATLLVGVPTVPSCDRAAAVSTALLVLVMPLKSKLTS